MVAELLKLYVLARQGLHDADSPESLVNTLTGTGGNCALRDGTLLMVKSDDDVTCFCSR
jgi:hypothetical protein